MVGGWQGQLGFGGPVTCALLLSGVLALTQTAQAAGPPPVDEPSEHPIDPEEIVPKKGTNPSWGDDQRRLDEVAAGEDPLCVIRTGTSVARVFYIPYAFHEKWRPCHGPERERMSYRAFYERLGRPDLAAKERRRDTLKLTLTLAQIVTLFAGSTLIVVGGAEEDWVPFAIGLSLVLIGFPTLGVVNGGFSPMGTPVGEAERLAADFNRAPVNRLPVSRSPGQAPQFALQVPVFQLRF